MKYNMIFIVLIFSCFTSFAGGKPNLLSGKLSKYEINGLLIPKDQWIPLPPIEDREAWTKAHQPTLRFYHQQAVDMLDYRWPSVPATSALLFIRNGNRSEYQQLNFQKRINLGIFLLAEIYENEGRFIDQIIDGVWSICEESYWGVPAHLEGAASGIGLPDVTDPFVDLFAAETATYLAWVYYFLGDRLDQESIQIKKRIYYEVNKRIFEPVMTYYHWWMGPILRGTRPNNWTPWICSNWLNAVLLLEENGTRRTMMVHRILEVLDEFMNPHPHDGGCDEGPSYWKAAAASVFDNVSLLNAAMNDNFSYVYADEKFQNMGKYIYRVQISEKYFMNFADAQPAPPMDGSMIWRYGKAIEDEEMQKFGAYYTNETPKGLRFHFMRDIFELFVKDEILSTERGLPLPSDAWMPDLQVMVARDHAGSTDGFYIAAKGGHNDESHNHNDIGNYVVYYDGQPLIVDVGRGTYTAKTFGPRRYEIWYNRSDYHNLPTINGYTQLVGPRFKASDINYTKGDHFAQLSLDIAKAYPASAGIDRWSRTVRLNKNENVVITDQIQLSKADDIVQHLMTCWPAEILSPGNLRIRFSPNGHAARNFIVKYNPDHLKPTIEKITLDQPEDEGVINNWGRDIYRINFKESNTKLSGTYVFTLVRE
jgi:hypothetical protein